MNRKAVIYTLVAFLVLSLTGAAIYFKSKPVVSPETAKVKFGYLPIADSAPLYIAIDEGMFQKAGIEPQVTSIRAGALVLEALGTQNIDVGFSNTLSFIFANSSGVDLVSLGGVAVNDQEHKEGAILVKANSQIKAVQDLRGKTMAINARKNIVELSIRQLLKKNGVPPDDVRFVEIPFPQMENVLGSNQVDAIAVAEPFWTFAENHGGVRVLAYYYGDVYDSLEVTSWFATRQWIEKNPETAKKVHEVFVNAVSFLQDKKNENKVREIIAKYTQTDVNAARQIRLPSFKPQLTRDGLQRISDGMRAEGFLEKPVVLDNVLYR